MAEASAVVWQEAAPLPDPARDTTWRSHPPQNRPPQARARAARHPGGAESWSRRRPNCGLARSLSAAAVVAGEARAGSEAGVQAQRAAPPLGAACGDPIIPIAPHHLTNRYPTQKDCAIRRAEWANLASILHVLAPLRGRSHRRSVHVIPARAKTDTPAAAS